MIPRFLATLLLALTFLPKTPPGETDKPKLVVLVVFDQFRGDYLARWQELFTHDGFARLTKDGAWFKNCHYPYGTTVTGAGHASILTGTCPDKHGIVGNDFYDWKAGTKAYCAASPMYHRVPPAPKRNTSIPPAASASEAKSSAEETRGGSPQYLLVPTFADALKDATGGKAKVVGLSLKDRSAILPVGKQADVSYWLDSADGQFVTSSYYRDSPHPWVMAFNQRRLADQWACKEWDRLLDIDYAKYSGPDAAEGEGEGIVGKENKFRQGMTFPHPFTAGGRKDKAYYDAVVNSPAGNELLLEFVKEAVIAEQLGHHEAPDLLAVSFSSNDYIGHAWGPDSQEVLDVTLRSDRLMADFLAFLDKEVGRDNYLLVMTADHGVCPLPEMSAKKHIDTKRLQLKELADGAHEHLRKTFDKDATTKGKWFEIDPIPPWFYLNHRLIESCGLTVDEVAASLADYMVKQPGIERAFTRADLARTFGPEDPLARRVQRSFHPEHCGDVVVVSKPYYLFSDPKNPKGTTHGTPHPYDTYVPLLVFGANVKPGIREGPVVPQSAAAIFAQALGIKPPAAAEFPTPEGLFVK